MAFAALIFALELVAYGSLGPRAMQLLWGAEYSISAVEITSLAFATSAWVFVDLIGQAILARVGSFYLSIFWVLGAILLTGLMVVLPFDIIFRFAASSILTGLVVGGFGFGYLISSSGPSPKQAEDKPRQESKLPKENILK